MNASHVEGFVEKVSATTSHLHKLLQGMSVPTTGEAIVMYGPLAGSLLVPVVAVPILLCGCCASKT